MAFIDRPNDPQVREKLLDALAAVVDPAFEGDDDTASARLDDLLRQARVGGYGAHPDRRLPGDQTQRCLCPLDSLPSS
jgi:hypothetical protein